MTPPPSGILKRETDKTTSPIKNFKIEQTIPKDPNGSNKTNLVDHNTNGSTVSSKQVQQPQPVPQRVKKSFKQLIMGMGSKVVNI